VQITASQGFKPSNNAANSQKVSNFVGFPVLFVPTTSWSQLNCVNVVFYKFYYTGLDITFTTIGAFTSGLVAEKFGLFVKEISNWFPTENRKIVGFYW